MNDFIIRPAGLHDMGAVNALLRQVLKVHHDGRPDLFREEGKKYTDEELQGIFANPETPVFVYESDGAVLGYVFCALRHPSGGSGVLLSRADFRLAGSCAEFWSASFLV